MKKTISFILLVTSIKMNASEWHQRSGEIDELSKRPNQGMVCATTDWVQGGGSPMSTAQALGDYAAQLAALKVQKDQELEIMAIQIKENIATKARIEEELDNLPVPANRLRRSRSASIDRSRSSTPYRREVTSPAVFVN